MKAYVTLPKNTEFVDGLIDFSKFGMVTILSNLQDCLRYLKDDNVICEFEFTDDNEVVDAVNSAVSGDNTLSSYHVRWLNVYTKKTLGA